TCRCAVASTRKMRLRTLLKARMIFFSAWMFSSVRRSALITSAVTSPRCTPVPHSSSDLTGNFGSSSLRTAMSLLGSSATTWTGISAATFARARHGPFVHRDPAPDDERSRPSAGPKTSLLPLADCGLLLRALDLRAALGFLLAGLDLHEANAGIAAVDPDQLAAPEVKPGG